MKLNGLAWAGAASLPALEKMRAGTLETAMTPNRKVPTAARKRAAGGALVLAGLFSLAVAFALLVALVIERARP